MNQLCEACGHSNAPGSRFCSSCGRPLSSAEEASTEALEPLGDDVESVDFQTPSTGAALVVASGHQAGTRMRLLLNGLPSVAILIVTYFWTTSLFRDVTLTYQQITRAT